MARLRFPHARLAPRWFQALLNAEGLTYRLALRRARLCPCQDTRGSGPDPACPLCGGAGYLWEDPPQEEHERDLLVPLGDGEERMSGPTGRLPHAWASLLEVEGPRGPEPQARLEGGRLVLPPDAPRPALYRVRYRAPRQGRGHVQDLAQARTWAERGEVERGELLLTVPRLGPEGEPNPIWDLRPHDQVVLLDHRLEAQGRMVRGVREALAHPWVLEVREARALLGGQEVRYPPGEAFRVEGGRVVWAPGQGPPPRTPYVLEYVAAPVYYVLEDLGARRHVEGWDLPRRVRLRLFEAYPGRGR